MSSGGHNIKEDTNAIIENTSSEQYEQLKQTIVEACISNSISTVIDILSHNKELCTEQLSWYDSSSREGDEMMSTPLIFICIDYQHVELIEKILQLYYSADMLNTLVGGDGEYTTLQWASYMGNLQIVKLLIEKGGANPDDKEALSLAEEDDHMNVYEYLLDHVNAYGDFENMHIGSSSDESSYGSNAEEDRKKEAVIVAPRNKEQPKDTPTPTIIRSGSLLTFSIPSSDGELSLKLNQSKTKDNNQGSNETNTGFVMWPSAVMLSHHLTQNPDIVLGNGADGSDLDGSVMELGSGCGLAGLTAATLLENSGSLDKVIFTDYNPSVLENLRKNVQLNEFDVDHKVLGLDWFDQQQQLADEQIKDNDEEDEETATTAKDSDENSNTWVDMEGKHHDQARLIIGSDLIVCSNDAELVAATLDCALLEGGQAIIIGADSCTRFGVKEFPNECRLLGLDVEVNENIWQSTTDHVDGDEDQLKNELELGGYDQRAACSGHDFTMFTIHKPISEVPVA